MKFGVRECCDVVFRAKAPMKVGNKIFYKNEPVIYFDTLKTSTFEGAASTVYAQGGRGNARLMSWDGERTVTFTMEDALISPEGLSILSGAGLVEASNTEPIYVHATERIPAEEVTATVADGKISVTGMELGEDDVVVATKNEDNTIEDAGAEIYVLLYDPQNNLVCEPFSSETVEGGAGKVTLSGKTIAIAQSTVIAALADKTDLKGYTFLVDYYVKKNGGAMAINIAPDKFGGAFYIEASTLFRDQSTQKDMPAEFIIPNARVQSNFTFTMAGSGDPSSFTFTMDAFPDYTRFDRKEKVLASIQVISANATEELFRDKTNTARVEKDGVIVEAEEDDE